MTAAQTRLADHIDKFYSAADRTSEGAMASHAYKASVTELDAVIQRELVRVLPLCSRMFCSQVVIVSPRRYQDAPYRTTILDPVGKMNAYFPIVNEHISKRNKKVGNSVLPPMYSLTSS